MSQATSHVSTEAAAAEEGDGARGRSWWLTLPGILTGLAGLISAVTGLIVAVHQLRPASHPAAATSQVSALGTNTYAGNTPAATAAANRTSASNARSALRVSFSEGRHAQVGAYQYDILTATARPGNPGQLGLALRVRMTNRGGFPANFWSATFRLRLGASITAPTNMLDDVVAAGTTDIGEVDFTTLPASTRHATLLVGDDASRAVALPVSLSGGKR